jgi:hypothetical protein
MFYKISTCFGFIMCVVVDNNTDKRGNYVKCNKHMLLNIALVVVTSLFHCTVTHGMSNIKGSKDALFVGMAVRTYVSTTITRQLN